MIDIYWLSPTDAEATEIARYSAQLLPCLQEFARIRGVYDGEVADAPSWWRQHAAVPEQSVEAEPGLEPLPIYHIGNNPLHLSIAELARQEPGLLVLHDLSLLDLAKHWSRQYGEPDLWMEMMLRQYGEEVYGRVISSEQSLDDYNRLVAESPLFLHFVENAMGVVVHSHYAREVLQRQLPAGFQVRQLNLPSPPPPSLVPRDYGANCLQFVFCGHLGPNRRLREFFEAWGRLQSPDRLRLDIFGKVNSSSQLMQSAQACGVAPYVKLRGYVEDAELEAALHSAHFALNLRWPTMGEASASQLRYWSAALPTLVTDVGWYSEIPDDVVCKISPEREIDQIHSLLEDLLQSPQTYQQIGQRGRQHLATEHTARRYAQELVGFAVELRNRRLAYRALDRELVGIIASMCEDGTDAGLFRHSIETAVATLERGGDNQI